MQKPKIGDKIIHTEYVYDRITKGEVIQILALQFLYQAKDGHIRHCMFKEDWKHENN